MEERVHFLVEQKIYEKRGKKNWTFRAGGALNVKGFCLEMCSYLLKLRPSCKIG
jgi:hypothetical protein